MAGEPAPTAASGILDPLNLSYAFGMSGPTGQLGYEELQRRRAIAQALASQKRGYPKNIGEGLTALGEAVGDRFTDRRLAAAENAYITGAPKLAPGGAAGATPPTTTPPVGTPPPAPATAAVPASPPVPGTPLTPSVPSVPSPRANFNNPSDTLKDRIAMALNRDPGGGPTQNPTEAAETPPQAPSVASFPEATASGDGGNILEARRSAIGGIESGGRKDPYNTIGVQTRYGRALGRYGVTEANVGPWTQAALGQALTPQQFLGNKEVQDAVFDHRFGLYVNRFGEENAARAWYGGPGNIGKPNLKDVHERLSIADYGKDYLRRLQKAAGGGAAPGSTPQPGPTPASFQAGLTSADQSQGYAFDDTGPPNVESDTGGGDTGGDNPPTPTTIRPAPKAVYTDISKPPDVKTPRGTGVDPRFTISPDVGPYPTKNENLTEEETRGYAALNDPRYGRDPAIQARANALIKFGADRREAEYQRRVDDWKLRSAAKEKEAAEQMKWAREGQPKAEAELRRADFEQTQREAQAKIKDRLGGLEPKEFIENFKPMHAEATQAVSAINNINRAESAIRAGAITGYGANARTDLQRLQAWALNNNISAKTAAETELLKTSLASMIGQAVQKIQPGDSRVTEGDLKMAQGLAGTIDQQREAILKILAANKQDAHETINAFEELRHKRVGGTALEDSFQLKTRPIAPPEGVKILLEGDQSDNAKAWFDKRFGPGSAQLVIDRARRDREAAERK